MSAPPAPVVQPVSLMNQLSATASTNAASAVSAYSGPADAPSPIPRPERAIHALPNTGPYQRKPMTIAAAVATTIATQFTCPSSNARYVRAQARARAQAFRPRARTGHMRRRSALGAAAPRSRRAGTGPDRSRGAYARSAEGSPSRGTRRRSAAQARYRRDGEGSDSDRR